MAGVEGWVGVMEAFLHVRVADGGLVDVWVGDDEEDLCGIVRQLMSDSSRSRRNFECK